MNKSVYEMSPSEWLQYQRKQQGYNEKLIPIKAVQKELQDRFGKLPADLQRVLSQYSTFTRADVDDEQIAVQLRTLRRIIKQEEWIRIKDVFIGVFPTYEVDGFAGRTPRGDKIVMLHAGLFVSLSLLADLFVCERDSYNEGENFLESNLEAVLQHLACVSKLWVENQTLQAMYSVPMAPTTAESMKHSGAIGIAAATFFLGHELGHIIDAHRNYDWRMQELNHKMEYDADHWGLRFCIRYILFNLPALYSKEIIYSRLSLLGPFLALGLIAAISNERSLTHPSASDRFERIKNIIKDVIRDEFNAFSADGDKMYKAYKKSMGEDFEGLTLSLGEKIFKKHISYGNLIRALNKGIKQAHKEALGLIAR